MATIALVCRDDSDRERLALMAGESGHLVHGAGRLADAVELIGEFSPRLMLVVDAPNQDAEVLVRELLRVSPLTPVVVALKVRDASRAVRLMRTGAAEVVSAPWTREALQAGLAKAGRLPGTVYTLTRTPPKRPTAAVYAFAALAFFAAAFGTMSVKRHEAQVKAEAATRYYWDLPSAHPASLAFDEGRLWVADWFTQSLYAYDPANMAIKRIVHFPDQTPIALAFGADSVWTASAFGGVSRRMKDDSLTAVENYDRAAQNTLGIAFDGLYLWTLDSKEHRIHKHLVDSELSEIASYKYPGVSPVAIVYDGRTLWSLDSANHELVRHNLERPDEAVERISLPEYKDGRHRPVGLAWDGEHFWTVGEPIPKDIGPARVYRHLIWGLK
jgi:CheY-like chemotaxis protein